MQIRLPYGRSFLTAVLPDNLQVDVIEAPHVPAAADPGAVVQAALDNLIGDLDWSMCTGARSVGIAVNDKTRPVPHDDLLPPLLSRLAALGIPDEVITFYIAVGTHEPMRQEEFAAILPEAVLRRYTVVSHDSEDDENLLYLGETSTGTPVWTNKGYARADFKIVIGNLVPHQFVGFSGGVKTAAIGLGGLKTINHNHALMTHPDARLGEYEANPVRQDIEEMGAMIGVNLALNAILDQRNNIVEVLAGNPKAVMRAGIPRTRLLCQVGVKEEYGLMIASPGGHPKDINVYQAQKGLLSAALVTRPGGVFILAAACPEGPGSPHYESWMRGKRSYDEVLAQFRAEGFRVGAHKAYLIARDASKLRLLFCSELDEALSRDLLFNPVSDLQTAIDMALVDFDPGERVGVIPHAAATIPYLDR